MSVCAFRSRRWAAYVLSLFVLASAAWMPTSVYPQAIPGGGSQGAPSSPGVSWPVSDEVFKVCDDGDNTKCAELENSGMTTANTGVISASGTAAAFTLGVTGGFRVGDGSAGAPPFAATSDSDSGFLPRAGVSGQWMYSSDGTAFFIFATELIQTTAAGCYKWTDGIVTGTQDTRMCRHSAGVVVFGNGTTSIRGLIGGGAAIASATALPLPTGRVFHVTGTTTVTSITSTNFESGAVITLIFDGALTFTDGSNLVLAGNFVTTASDTITLVYDGTNWHETSRSVN